MYIIFKYDLVIGIMNSFCKITLTLTLMLPDIIEVNNGLGSGLVPDYLN